MADPSLRASDAERDRVVEVLREACAEGRLTVAEFQERLDTAYAARTHGELAALTADLPQQERYQLPVPVEQGTRPAAPRGPMRYPVVPAEAGAWVTASLVCVVIWALAGAHGYFWPAWVIGPWGAVLLGRAITTRRR